MSSDSCVQISSSPLGTPEAYVSSREQSFITGKTVFLAIGVILATGIMVASPFLFHDLGLRHLYLIGPEVAGGVLLSITAIALACFKKPLTESEKQLMTDLKKLDVIGDDSQSHKDILEKMLDSRGRLGKVYFQSSSYSMQYEGKEKWFIQEVWSRVQARGSFKQVKNAILVKWKNGRFIVKPSVLIESRRKGSPVEIPQIGVKSEYILIPKPVGILDARAARAVSDLSKLPREVTGKEFLQISANFLKGIDALHAKGKIHGDVKPENALFFGKGRVKICDLDSVKDEAEAGQFTSQSYSQLAPCNRKIFLEGRFLPSMNNQGYKGRFDLATQRNIDNLYFDNDEALHYLLNRTNEVASAGFALAGMYFKMRAVLTLGQQTEYCRIINELTGGWGLMPVERDMGSFSFRVDQEILGGREMTLPAEGALTKAIAELERLSAQV